MCFLYNHWGMFKLSVTCCKQNWDNCPTGQILNMPSTLESGASVTSSPFFRVLFSGFLFRLLHIFRSERLSQRSFMPLPHNCASAVISSSAKVTPLFFSVGGSTDYGPHTQFWQQHKDSPSLQ